MESKNSVSGSISAQGHVILGDNDSIITNNFFLSALYKDLKAQDQELSDRFDVMEQAYKDSANEDRLKLQLSEILHKRRMIRERIELIGHEVIKLTEDFARFPLSTEGLRLAKQHFEAGDYNIARALFDAEEAGMRAELDALLSQKKQADTDSHLAVKSNEYLILARLTVLDHSQQDRFDKAMERFETSLKALRTGENLFAYAYFLLEHHQFVSAQPLYEEALGIYRKLAEANPAAYLPYVAMTLSNLGHLHANKNKNEEKENAYREALEISRKIAEPNASTDVSGVVGTLNNLTNVQSAGSELKAAEEAYQEAMEIYRNLADEKPEDYLTDVARMAATMSLFYLKRNPDKK
ncbi:MAG: tetratricopeptide repeat protein, partial [Desulfobulbaceae bacterium]|nr:tetratricopeptide repeat protein [Desulfobulbaceae bacterium]